MSALVERSDQLVNLTELARKVSGMMDRVATAEKERLVVLRKSEPIAVVLNVSAFESMLDELDVLRTQNIALHRLINAGSDSRIGSDEMQQSLRF